MFNLAEGTKPLSDKNLFIAGLNLKKVKVECTMGISDIKTLQITAKGNSDVLLPEVPMYA